ncbi:hypothetical protein GYMLUDRAFT_48084 [Collybiopsis luxurians FD-317 M1]|uniref:NmrA-like domain-containing protein n=1 Tax=Collybiopsis luxurians FD-317 M1 TaxID=944289 RepID=A0A0D0CJG1_9AGAR|nr:hypothetical protein GYMLUDRAFT_48084 [Collybiopsis luxurians FD-317 M1]
MSTRNLTSFAFIGTGYIGSIILSAFLAQAPDSSTLVVLSRNPDRKKFPPRVKVVKVDNYSDIDTIADIFFQYKIDAVVSTVAAGAVQTQRQMADAAKKAGVKLFVLSEFGSPTDGAPDEYPPFQEKDEVAKYVDSIGLSWARVYTGGFINRAIYSVTGFRVNNKINIIGKGHSPVSFTFEEDIGGFVAYALTSLSLSSLSNRIFRLQGDRASLQDIAKWYKKEIAYVEAIPGPDSEIRSMLSRVFESGAGSTGWNFELGREGEGEEAAGSANKLWPGHRWKGIRDVITRL